MVTRSVSWTWLLLSTYIHTTRCLHISSDDNNFKMLCLMFYRKLYSKYEIVNRQTYINWADIKNIRIKSKIFPPKTIMMVNMNHNSVIYLKVFTLILYFLSVSLDIIVISVPVSWLAECQSLQVLASSFYHHHLIRAAYLDYIDC